MIENFISYMKLSIVENLFIVAVISILFCIYLIYKNTHSVPRNIVLNIQNRNYKRIYKETRVFIFIDNEKYYLDNVEDINKTGKLLDTNKIVLDNTKKIFYFINE